MSLDARQTDSPRLTTRSELEAYFRGAERRDGTGLIGLEHEKLLFPTGTARPVAYDGPAGVGALLEAFLPDGWEPFREAPERPIIALTRDAAAVSLEPGGQFEWAGSPLSTARAASEENAAHVAKLKAVATKLGLRSVALGYRPFGRIADMPWMPKSRYGAMQRTLGTAGSHALEMMLMTATGQVSLDWKDEADCARKVTCAARLSPVTVALFANSPIVDGKLTDHQSYRSRVWNDVDPARCGTPAFLVDGSFSYAKYVDWALAAPMLFLRRDGRYLTPKLTFGQFFERGFEEHHATQSDWVDHLSTLFPEVRIKKVLEVRSADANGVAMTGALAALTRGLLYDRTATDEASALMAASPEKHHSLHLAAQRDGMGARADGRSVLDLAREAVRVAKDGLRRLDPADVGLLEPLEAIVAEGRSPAVRVVEAFQRSGGAPAFLDAFEL